MVNVVTLIGNLATDVELKELAEGKRVASFVLAVDRASKEGGADFVRVSVWDRQADLCKQFLHCNCT
jgi:single-stranded DNA-binding protein